MFNITDRKGFQITFTNGWTISCQWGAANYCANRGKFDLNSALRAAYLSKEYLTDVRSQTCEFFAFNNQLDLCREQANVTADMIAQIIPLIASITNDNFVETRRNIFAILDKK